MKKVFTGIILTLAILAGLSWMVAGMGYEVKQPSSSLGGGFTVEGDKTYLTAGSGISVEAGQIDATTTVHYLTTTNGTSTITAFSGRADQADLLVWLTSSTTASTLLYAIDFSPDGSIWYKEDGSLIDSSVSITHGAGDLVNSWTPARTAATAKNFTISGLGSKYFRVRMSAAGANAALWAATIPKEPTPN